MKTLIIGSSSENYGYTVAFMKTAQTFCEKVRDQWDHVYFIPVNEWTVHYFMLNILYLLSTKYSNAPVDDTYCSDYILIEPDTRAQGILLLSM